jgi:hypothetical protein
MPCSFLFIFLVMPSLHNTQAFLLCVLYVTHHYMFRADWPIVRYSLFISRAITLLEMLANGLFEMSSGTMMFVVSS